jgi:hypothetical protein
MGLMADLGGGPVGVDTAIFIYFIEEHPQFLPLIELLFREVHEGRKELVTSSLPCSKSWSFPAVLETIRWPGDMKLFSRRVAASTSQIFLVIICAPPHS